MTELPFSEEFHFIVPHDAVATLLVVGRHYEQLLKLFLVVPSATEFTVAK